MNATTLEKLFAEFSPASDADWRRAAEEALDGAAFEKRLVTPTPEGIALQPIYTPANGEKPGSGETWPGLPPYTRGAEALGSRAAGWFICQDPGCVRADDFNSALRFDLSRGQNAVRVPLDTATRLGLDPKSAPPGYVADVGLSWATVDDVGAALRGVELEAVPLFTSAGVAGGAVARLLTGWLAREGKPVTSLHGAVLGDPLAEWLRRGELPTGLEAAFDDLAALTAWAQSDNPRLRTIGVDASLWAEAGGHAVQELAFGLAAGTACLRALEERGLGVEATAPRVLFTYSLGSNLFMEIAKLRAARLLWYRAIQAAGGGADGQRLVCHGRTSRWNKTVLDAHVNLLRATSEAFAGVVGGCAGVHVGTFDECYRGPDEFSRRLARNIQIILAEECQLGQVVDPAGGSWYVEALTRELATSAWGLFQEIEAQGGMVAAIRAGFPQGLVEKTAAERITAVEQRRDGIIGTNLHPNLRERVPAVESYVVHPTPAPALPPPGVKPLRPRRRAEPFEVLRRRTDVFLTRTGARPKVFLVGLGPRKQHAARADFSRAFFAAGGFEPVLGSGFDTPEAAAHAAVVSGAPIVVLCSSDDTYPVLVPPLARALQASATPPLVVLAGLPATPELQQQFKSAGVNEFIHLRANCATLLAGFLDQLGL